MGVTVLLADEQKLFAFGIRKILEMLPEHDFVGHVENGQEVIVFLEKNQRVDVLVLDLNMSVMGGLQLLPYLNRKFPELKKMVVTAQHNRSMMQLCRNLGANGFIGKDACLDTFKNALQVIADGGEYYQPVDSAKSIINGHKECLYQRLRDTYSLSDRETEILQMILNQCPTPDIAEKLSLSPLTVKTHRRNIFKKLKIKNLSGLLAIIKEYPAL